LSEGEIRAAFPSIFALDLVADAAGEALERYSFVEIQVGVFKCEIVGDGWHAWPEAVLIQIEKQLAQWRERNRGRRVVMRRFYAIPGQCSVAIYHDDARAPIDEPQQQAPELPLGTPAAPTSPHACMRCGE
jgi:hypothetical protein